MALTDSIYGNDPFLKHSPLPEHKQNQKHNIGYLVLIKVKHSRTEMMVLILFVNTSIHHPSDSDFKWNLPKSYRLRYQWSNRDRYNLSSNIDRNVLTFNTELSQN